MSKKKFISNISSVLADIRKLDAKKIVLDNKDIIDHIKENAPTIKHSKDTRETVYANDLWGLRVETKADGTVIIHDDYLRNPKDSSDISLGGGLVLISSSWLNNVRAVQNNKAYSEITTDGDGNFTGVVEDSVIANIQTNRVKNGGYMFERNPITSFSGDLSSLIRGYMMFSSCNLLTSFSGNLSNLIDGTEMFRGCTSLTSFNSDLSSLTNGDNMFFNCTSLTSFSGDLRSLICGGNMFRNTLLTSFSGNLGSLTNGASMFRSAPLTSFNSDLSNLIYGANMFLDCASLTSFNSDLSNLVDSGSMFLNCTSLTSFSGDLSSLVNGINMFTGTSLTPQSVMYIVESIRNITEEKAKYTSGEIPWVTYDSETQKYSAPFGFMEDGRYVYTYNDPDPYTDTISASNVGNLTLGINVTNDPDTLAQLLQTFAEGCLYESWDKLVQAFTDKGWTVTFTYKGTNSPITLPEEGE